MVSRPLFSLAAFVLLAVAVLFQLFIVLSGAIKDSTPFTNTFFLQSTTTGIPGARNPTRWTYFSICGVDAGGASADCGATVPALPFNPVQNFNTTTGVPQAFVGTSRYFYLSRFSWVFYLLALLFGALAFLTGLLAIFTRLGAYISALLTFLSLGFQIIAASLMTAWTVQGRNLLRASGQTASLGRYAYAWSWAAVACLSLGLIMFVLGGRRPRGSGPPPQDGEPGHFDAEPGKGDYN